MPQLIIMAYRNQCPMYNTMVLGTGSQWAYLRLWDPDPQPHKIRTLRPRLHCYKNSVIMLILSLSFRYELKFLYHSNCLYEGPYWVLSYYKFSSHYVDFFGKNSWGYIVTFMCNGPQISQFQYKGRRFRICISCQRENNNLECVW